MRKIWILMAFFGLTVTQVEGQSGVDALRYSLTPNNGTTARSLGLGGAIGAIGADQSVVLSNPAGLAQFRTNSFNFSLSTNSLKNKSIFEGGNENVNNQFLMQIPSVNVVWTNRKMIKGNPVKTGWVNTNFQIGYNRVADYNRNMSFRRNGSQSSLTDYVADYVGGLDPSELEANTEQLDRGFYFFENMFWHTYLIDSLGDRNYYANYDPEAPGGITQNGQILREGGKGEYHAAFAANYEHKVYFGASINVNQVNNTEKNSFAEEDNAITQNNWSSYRFTRNLETRGFGFGGRLGVVFRPNDNLRLGGTLHTPTVLNLTDEYFDELYVTQDDRFTDDHRTIDKEYSYTVTTPARYGLQGAYIFGKKGLISAEIEAIDYSTMNIQSDDDLFEDVNAEIANQYRNTANVKIGGEYVINAFRLRAGFISIGNPMANTEDYNRNIISGGFGIQERNWAFDIGISRDMTSDVNIPYDVQGIERPVVNSDFAGTRLMLTLTSKF